MEQLLVKLGFIIHEQKSQTIPAQRCKWLGLIFDTRSMTLELSQEKRYAGRELINKFSQERRCKIREFARFI